MTESENHPMFLYHLYEYNLRKENETKKRLTIMEEIMNGQEERAHEHIEHIQWLKERGILGRNAPHLVKNLPFIVPSYDWWEGPFYGIGLKLYDLLAGKEGLSTLH